MQSQSPSPAGVGLKASAVNTKRLDEKRDKIPTNRSVSFNAIKNHAFNLLLGKTETDGLE